MHRECKTTTIPKGGRYYTTLQMEQKRVDNKDECMSKCFTECMSPSHGLKFLGWKEHVPYNWSGFTLRTHMSSYKWYVAA